MKIRIDVVFERSTHRWAAKDNKTKWYSGNMPTVACAIRTAVWYAKEMVWCGNTVNLYIHRKDGERTYPRSADPRKSKG